MAPRAADLVRIRAAVFIPDAWIEPDRGDETGSTVEFRGDDRGFTPHAADTGRSRVEQEAVVDFARERFSTRAAAGRSMERITHPDGTETYEEATASTDGVFDTDPDWHEGGVAFDLHASASNPLVAHPSPVDYHLELAVDRDGTVAVTGRHDGYPCFECYAQTDFGEYRELYRYDYRESGETNAALAGPMEYEFERRA